VIGLVLLLMEIRQNTDMMEVQINSEPNRNCHVRAAGLFQLGVQAPGHRQDDEWRATVGRGDAAI